MDRLEIPIYSPETIEYIEVIQKQKLSSIFGPDFESKLTEIFPSTEMFCDHIEAQLNSEFGNSNDDLRYELEAQLWNKATDEIKNLTSYEFPQYKSLLNSAELKFRQSVTDPIYLDHIPYSATLHSFETNAEILPYPSADKPTIFFHGGLFSANLLFCKLAIQLIRDTKDETNEDNYANFSVKEDPAAIAMVTLNAAYFYNYYFSETSGTIPDYDVQSPFENSILAIFLDSIAFFIYAHETGHAILKHGLSETVKSDEEKWREEYEADRFAMIHLRNYCEVSRESILTLLAPIIFFRYQTLRERYVHGLEAVNSHPPAINRLIKYVTWLLSERLANDRETIVNFLKFEERLFALISPIFDRIHSAANNRTSGNPG